MQIKHDYVLLNGYDRCHFYRSYRVMLEQFRKHNVENYRLRLLSILLPLCEIKTKFKNNMLVQCTTNTNLQEASLDILLLSL